MMQVFRAPADVAHWIEGAVVIRLGSAGTSHFPALPHAMLTMRLVPLEHRPADAAALCGPITFHTITTEPAVYAHAGRITAMGLLVRPAAAACLLGHATGAMVDRVLPWNALAGTSEAARLEDEVESAGSDIARLQALLASFRRTMSAVSRGRDAGFERLCTAIGLHGAQAHEHLGLGRRQLERHCQAVLGIAPKQFQRLTRFHKALSMAVTHGASHMAQLAAEAGFYDQSHLGRDARELAGESMGRLLSAARPDSTWWSLASRRSLNRSDDRRAFGSND